MPLDLSALAPALRRRAEPDVPQPRRRLIAKDELFFALIPATTAPFDCLAHLLGMLDGRVDDRRDHRPHRRRPAKKVLRAETNSTRFKEEGDCLGETDLQREVRNIRCVS